jgi:hypothetical protein
MRTASAACAGGGDVSDESPEQLQVQERAISMLVRSKMSFHW